MQKAIMDRVFIKPDEKKAGSLIIEDKDETKTGIVVSVGDGVTSVQAGDHVVFFKWDDLPALDGLIVVREYSLLGVLNDE